eukprot:6191888-Pyramimonas_sp.AAC.1
MRRRARWGKRRRKRGEIRLEARRRGTCRRNAIFPPLCYRPRRPDQASGVSVWTTNTRRASAY